MASSQDIESQGIGLHARHGVPEPEFPDIQEPEPALPQKRYVNIYTFTRVLCGLLIVTNTAMDWALYAELEVSCTYLCIFFRNRDSFLKYYEEIILIGAG